MMHHFRVYCVCDVLPSWPAPRRHFIILKRYDGWWVFLTIDCAVLGKCMFGILLNNRQILHSAIQIALENAMNFIRSTCVLHNCVMEMNGYIFGDSLHHTIEQTQWSRVRRNMKTLINREKRAKYFMLPAVQVCLACKSYGILFPKLSNLSAVVFAVFYQKYTFCL